MADMIFYIVKMRFLLEIGYMRIQFTGVYKMSVQYLLLSVRQVDKVNVSHVHSAILYLAAFYFSKFNLV
jgi:hypothetical protein